MTLARFGDRTLFPHLKPAAYLNHAAVSPFSTPVADAIASVAAQVSEDGVGGAIAAAELRGRVRGRFAEWLGVPARDVGLVPNTTLGVTSAAMSIPWKRGDRVLLFDEEFPANVTPWQRAAELFELELEVVETAPFLHSWDEGLAALQRRIADRPVRLVAVSLVQFHLGLRMPVEAIADRVHEAGGEVFVDGIQGLGVVPFRAQGDHYTGVDYLACGGHKWLMGAEGAGFLYVKASAAEALVPRLAGWVSHEDAWRFLFEGEGHLRYDRRFKRDASIFEGGAQSNLGYGALDASLELLASLGASAIFEHVQRYHDVVEPELVARGFESLRHPEVTGRSGSLCLRPPQPDRVVELASHLRTAGVAVSTPDGKLRLAPHWPNDVEREGPVLLAAVDGFLAGG